MEIIGKVIGESSSSSPKLSLFNTVVVVKDSHDTEVEVPWHDDYRHDSRVEFLMERSCILAKSRDLRFRLDGDLQLYEDQYGNQFPGIRSMNKYFQSFIYNDQIYYSSQIQTETRTYGVTYRKITERRMNLIKLDEISFPVGFKGQYYLLQAVDFAYEAGRTELHDDDWMYPYIYLIGVGQSLSGRPALAIRSIRRTRRLYWREVGRVFDPDELGQDFIDAKSAIERPVSWNEYPIWGNGVLTHPDISFTLSESYIRSTLSDIRNDVNAQLPRLTNDCLANVEFFDGNGIALIGDLLSLCELIEGNVSSITELFKAMKYVRTINKANALSKRVRTTARELSSLYLSYHYGYRLTRSDLLDLRQTIIEYCSRVKHSASYATTTIQSSDWDVKVVLRVLYSPQNPCSSLVAFADFFDLAPDLDNLWDLVPYSFIVDWFTSIGDAASSISTFFKLERSRLLGSTVSAKCTRNFRSTEWDGHVEAVIYERTAHRRWIPVPEIPISFRQPSDPKHFIEGGALICVKK